MTIQETLSRLTERDDRRSEFKVVNAIIESAELQCGDAGHGSLTSWIYVSYGGSSQGFGGYALYLPKSFRHHEMKSQAGHWIYRVMEIADVEDWKKVSGKAIRVIRDGVYIRAIAHIVKDDVFCPEIGFDNGGEK